MMKSFKALRWLVVLSMIVLLCAACAKKPSQSSVDDMRTDDEAIESSEMGTLDYGGIEESAIGEDGTGEEGSAFQAGEVTSLERVYFEFDQYILSEQAREILSRNAQYLQAYPEKKVIIEGHCDERGSDEYNLALGERRARSAQSYLISMGVSSSRISIISYGEEIPLDPENSEDAWTKNRRGEFKEVY